MEARRGAGRSMLVSPPRCHYACRGLSVLGEWVRLDPEQVRPAWVSPCRSSGFAAIGLMLTMTISAPQCSDALNPVRCQITRHPDAAFRTGTAAPLTRIHCRSRGARGAGWGATIASDPVALSHFRFGVGLR